MSRSDAERVADILDACARLAEIVELGQKEFDRNWLADGDPLVGLSRPVRRGG